MRDWFRSRKSLLRELAILRADRDCYRVAAEQWCMKAVRLAEELREVNRVES